uniref:(northern house mosquito) hypothetical protein n=1 Tax=Culex pipiens TaxID=7175 RepID=A0A8D8AXR5_CULPI
MVSLKSFRTLGRLYAWVMFLVSLGVIITIKLDKNATGTIISTVVDRIDVQLAIAFWFNQSNFEHIMLSLCAPFTQSVIYVVAAAIFEIAIVCKSAILVSLYDIFFFIMSIIDFIVFIILFKYFRGMFVDISEVERALYLIFAGWIVYVITISWLLRGVSRYIDAVNQPATLVSYGDVVVTEFVSVSATQVRY